MTGADSWPIHRVVLQSLLDELRGGRSKLVCVREVAETPASTPGVTPQRKEIAAGMLSDLEAGGLVLRPGSACEDGAQGPRGRSDHMPASYINLGRPSVQDGTATVEAGYYCGVRCAAGYRFSLEKRGE